ncbi:GNAT family N-acetyltransferase [Bacillus hwajinpoensis]|uniref:GNAT family N-acetyltransferase n=1 Tax=Guptibacillus hwajinpoensis TaxID=208199 RepID=A0A845EYI5_9BACL|nr:MULTISPECIES: GNAT family N-acetyltransferase [Bacillaceae]MYL63585.1 GNAT family N-acetyltransferase [Pseudalkalibacillus hwajinpoensis]PFG12768.1 putative GNAT family N-acyltransferase [Bacillus sp. es.036]
MQVKIVESKQELEDAFLVRHAVFVGEQQVPAELEIDDYESQAYHFVAYDNSKPTAAGRFRVINQIAKAERICVLSSYRKTGLGQLLMKSIEKHARELDLKEIKLNAQRTAVGFYEKLGYKTVSGEFIDAGIPHVTMIKTL